MSYRKKHISPKIRGLQKRTPLLLRPWFWLVVLAVFVAGTLFYAIFFWSAMQVAAIEIEGITSEQVENMRSVAWEAVNEKQLLLPWKNIFLIDTAKIEDSLKTQFPELATAQVQKKFFTTLVVSVEKRNAVAMFCTQSQECFLIDNQGVLFAPKKSENVTLPKITRTQDGVDKLGEAAVKPAVMQAIGNIQKSLEDTFSVTTKEIMLADTMVVATNEKWKAYFDPKEDLPGQITRMNALLKEKIKPQERKNLEYIYLQYKDRAYYK